jgi:hypothetical protein
MQQQVIVRSADGRYSHHIKVVEVGDATPSDDLKGQGFIPRTEAAIRLKRSRRQVAYYHKLLATHSDPYKVLLAREVGRSKPKFARPGSHEKANGLLFLVFRGKFVKDWIVDLKKPIQEPQLKVMRRVRDLFAVRKTESEVIAWIKRNEALITQDLEELLDERSNEFHSA